MSDLMGEKKQVSKDDRKRSKKIKVKILEYCGGVSRAYDKVMDYWPIEFKKEEK